MLSNILNLKSLMYVLLNEECLLIKIIAKIAVTIKKNFYIPQKLFFSLVYFFM